MNEISALIYHCDVLAFVVFKYRGYFHLLRCLTNSLRHCDLSFKQGKRKNSFLSWKLIKWAKTRKAPFVLIFQASEHISIHADMHLKPPTKQLYTFTFFKKCILILILHILFSGIEKCCCFCLGNAIFVLCYMLFIEA